jgi:nitrous oxidase accessory protein NosD/TolB-like protein
MKRRLLSLAPLGIALLFAALALGAAPARAEDKPALAVVDFSVQGAEPELGRSVAERLFSYIGASPDYRLVTRTKIDAILKEQNFQVSDLVSDEKRAAEFGEMLGARYIITGSVDVSKSFGDVHISAQFVDVETAEVLRNDFVEGPDARAVLGHLPALAGRLMGRVDMAPVPTPTPAPAEPRTLVVSKEGASPYASIQAAVDAARPGETVMVRAGTYRERVILKEGVHLVGDETAETRLEWEGPGHGISAQGLTSGSIRHFALDGLTGPAVSEREIRELEDAEVIDKIRLRSAIALIDSAIEVENCLILNANAGVLIWGARANPRVAGCHLQNQIAGVMVGGGASATIEENAAEACEEAGIWVYGPGSKGLLFRNTCRANKFHGIEFGAGGGGEAIENTSEDNAQAGIAVIHSNTSPTLRRNICRRNGKHGIAFEDASGLAEANTCIDNAQTGISVKGVRALPQLRDNIFQGNKEWSVVYYGGAQGESY